MPHSPIEQLLRQALQQFQSGKFGEAELLYRQVLTLDPHQPDAWHMLGGIAFQLKRHDLAVKLFNQAITYRPQWAQAHYNLGNAFRGLGKQREAWEAYKQAVTFRWDFAEAHLNLGNVAVEMGDLHGGMACYQRVLSYRPNYADAHNNLGNILKRLGRPDEAMGEYELALELRPHSAEVRSNLGTIFREQGRMEEALQSYRQAVALSSQSPMAHSNLLSTMLYLADSSPEAIFHEARQWNEIYAQPLLKEQQPHENDRAPERRLRIGYVSADFRRHSCAFFSHPLLTHHDRAHFEIFCYAENPQEDAVTKGFQSAADHWLVTRGMADTAFTQRIREDRIDILVDLMGHTADHRLLVFARQPAPIQVTYLGHPGTTGLDALDYRFTDPYADPPGLTETLHSEELFRLPATFLCYEPIAAAPAVNALPAGSGTSVTFVSCNDLSKLSSVTLEMWSKILHRLPTARLLLKSPLLSHEPTRQRVLARFARAGISADRLELHKIIPALEDHLAFYHRADIALDTYPYHGTTTTCEALWMGLPVITLAGKTHVSRVGVTLLHQVGLDDLIAASAEEYVEKAVTLAGDLPNLAALRAELRQRMEAAPLRDETGFARHVEEAYRGMWQKWCAQPEAR